MSVYIRYTYAYLTRDLG